jgi:hypothetical protein
MSFRLAAMTWGDVRNWVGLMVVAASVFFTMSKVRARKQVTRRAAFLKRFKASREGRRFHEDLEERDRGNKP